MGEVEQLTKDEVFILQRTAKIFSMVERGLRTNPCYSTDLPMIVGIKLTNRCNLRCKTCYEWNEQGYHHDLSKEQQCQELDFDLFKKVIDETESVKSNIYLWGGEPLFHTRFMDISYVMEKTNRISAICTNATLIHEHVDDLLRFSKYQELLIALDGLEKENNEIRGQGTFQKVVSNINTLSELRKKGEYLGKISVHCVITEYMIDKMYEFLEFMENLGVDTVVVCYPWYLSEKTSSLMDDFYERYFGKTLSHKPSWHAFKFSFPEEKVDNLLQVREKIIKRKWNMTVKFQPNIADDNIRDFVMDEEKRDEGHRCYSICDRMEVLPDGSISSCKHFPEFIVGNLKDSSVQEIWKNDECNKVRKLMSCGLMPTCTKCNNLYLHGLKKKSMKGAHE